MAIAPTATISYIQGCSPSVEPDFSVLFVYENKSGNIYVINEWFVEACKKAGLWDKSVIEAVKMVDGDLNLLNGTLPENIKKQFCTAFDQDQFKLIDCAAARQKWIDMGQSLNLFNGQSSMKYLNDLYLHARNRGLKSTYYLRGRAASKIEKSGAGDSGSIEKTEDEALACSIEAMANNGTCESCQ
jgi:ribonucleoside-diphosphate reductase alpha chain